MGFLDSIKKTLGMATGEFELRVQPEGCHVGGTLQGQLVLHAQKPLNIFSVNLELLHTFPDDHGYKMQDVFDGLVLAERISLQAGEKHEWPFYMEIPPQVAPSLGDFGWKIRATAALQGSNPITKEQPLKITMSPIISVVVEAVQSQFGFTYREAGADEECIWMTFNPGPSIKAHKRGLEISFDEQEDEILLWVALDPFKQSVIQRYHGQYDEREGSIEIEIEKARYSNGGEIDRQGIFHLLQPLFEIAAVARSGEKRAHVQ